MLMNVRVAANAVASKIYRKPPPPPPPPNLPAMMLTSLNANTDLIRDLQESIMAVEEKFAERNVALLDDIEALHLGVHNEKMDRLKTHISQQQSSVIRKAVKSTT